jgi:hypothetical protein
MKLFPFVPSHRKSARRARVTRWSRWEVLEKDRDCADLHICFVHEVEGRMEGHLKGGGMVESPQLRELMAVALNDGLRMRESSNSKKPEAQN